MEEAAVGVAAIKESQAKLAGQLMRYGERLEQVRERIEGAARLHHLLGLGFEDRDTHSEMEKLARKIDAVNLIDRYATGSSSSASNSAKGAAQSTPADGVGDGGNRASAQYWPHTAPNCAVGFDKSGGGAVMQGAGTHERTIGRADAATTAAAAAIDDEEDHSKMSDSGLGSCGRCDIDAKLMRTCSCHSFDESTNKSRHSDDVEEEEEEDDCFDSCGKKMLAYQMSTVTPNAHLYSYTSSIELPDMENICGLTPKIQK